jgi:hypothetical protein
MPMQSTPILWYIFEVETTSIHVRVNLARSIYDHNDLSSKCEPAFRVNEEMGNTKANAIHWSSPRKRFSLKHRYHSLAIMTMPAKMSAQCLLQLPNVRKTSELVLRR